MSLSPRQLQYAGFVFKSYDCAFERFHTIYVFTLAPLQDEKCHRFVCYFMTVARIWSLVNIRAEHPSPWAPHDSHVWHYRPSHDSNTVDRLYFISCQYAGTIVGDPGCPATDTMNTHLTISIMNLTIINVKFDRFGAITEPLPVPRLEQ